MKKEIIENAELHEGTEVIEKNKSPITSNSEEVGWEERFDEKYDSACAFCSCIEGDMYDLFPDAMKELKSFISQAISSAVEVGKQEQWELMNTDLKVSLNKRRELEVEALESSKLVPDRHYHKGKIHLIDDILQALSNLN